MEERKVSGAGVRERVSAGLQDAVRVKGGGNAKTGRTEVRWRDRQTSPKGICRGAGL